jgi:hypothetical protein
MNEKLLSELTGDIKQLKANVDKIDLSEKSLLMDNEEHRYYLNCAAGVEQHKLLAYISTFCSGSVIYDIGTFRGSSSLALSYNHDVRVISYNVENQLCVSNPPANIQYKIGDFRQDSNLLTSPFILIDIAPHDGILEQEFHEFFVNNNYEGIVLWDDIWQNGPPTIKHWWQALSHPNIVTKLDLTEVGHMFDMGTGLTVYKPQK